MTHDAMTRRAVMQTAAAAIAAGSSLPDKAFAVKLNAAA